MNPILLSGDENKFLGVSYDTIFTTLVTISIFLLGYLFNRFYDYLKDLRRLRDIRKLVHSHLQSLLGPIDERIQVYLHLGEFLISQKRGHYTFRQPTIHTEFLNGLTYTEVFLAFKLGSRKLRNERIDAFHSVYKAIDFIKSQNASASSLHSEHSHQSEELREKWSGVLQAIMRDYDTWLNANIRNQVPKSGDAFLSEFASVVNKVAKLENGAQMDLTFEHLIEPLKKLSINSQYAGDMRCMNLFPRLSDAVYAYKALNQLNKVYGQYFLEFAELLKKRREIIIGAIELIQ